MPLADDRRLPHELTAVAAIGFDYAEGDGVDFEPFDEFLTAQDTTHWLRAWTGNTALDGDAFRAFGQDGTGGYAAFWLARPARGSPINRPSSSTPKAKPAWSHATYPTTSGCWLTSSAPAKPSSTRIEHAAPTAHCDRSPNRTHLRAAGRHTT